MVKKKLNPLKIDYKKCIIEDRLLQVRNDAFVDKPDLINVWTVDISPKDSKQLIEFIKKLHDSEPVSFHHIKRIKKNSQNMMLTAIICSQLMIQSEEDFLALMKGVSFDFKNISGNFQIPRIGPSSKELCCQWSEKYWPVVWRGNPNDQILNDYVFDLEFITQILRQISKLSQLECQKNEIPVVTAFVNPLNRKVIYSVDQRKNGSPLDHSILCGIKDVAKLEQQRRDFAAQETSKNEIIETYLCLDFDIYTSHEPCSMCAMALIHSRIKRCIFLKSMPSTGCLTPYSGESYCMHNNNSLNSKYEVFKWIGDDFVVPNIDSHVCC